VEVSNVEDVDSCPYNWTEYFDPNTNKPYYYNLISKRTQWEKPVGYSSTLSITAPNQPEDASTLNSFKATFNRKTGAFGTASDLSYWETVGRPTDREGRQMSAFFDISSLDSNRQQAASIKEKLANSNIDWRAYRDKKKSDKHSKNKEWLLKDD
jgi:WW domain